MPYDPANWRLYDMHAETHEQVPPWRDGICQFDKVPPPDPPRTEALARADLKERAKTYAEFHYLWAKNLLIRERLAIANLEEIAFGTAKLHWGKYAWEEITVTGWWGPRWALREASYREKWLGFCVSLYQRLVREYEEADYLRLCRENGVTP